MNAVKRPGSLYFSAIVVVFAQTLLANRGSVAIGGNFLFACAATSSITAFFASTGPPLNISRHRLSVGSAIISGLPPLISVIMPIMSEWSVMATQSSGCPSFTGWPLVEVTSSPRANRVASSGPSVAPLPPASPAHGGRAAAAGIHRPRGVDVLVAEVRALGIIPACVRRVAGRLVEQAWIGRFDL